MRIDRSVAGGVRALVALLTVAACGGGGGTDAPLRSGGALRPEQAAYDVTFYDLALTVHPEERAVEGTLTAHARLTAPLDTFVLDLDPRLAVHEAAVVGEGPRPFLRRGGTLRIALGGTRAAGDTLAVRVRYGGRPRVAPRPPWEGGVTWATTPSGAPWIATSVQAEGADLWWPVKDHPSDEPDSLALRVTVPEPLVAAAGGRLLGVERTGGEATYHWFVSTPVNTYAVALAVAPYRTVEAVYRSVDGRDVPVAWFVLPGSEAAARAFLPEALDHLAFLEETLGPYPFRADKYGLAETPFLGMEHQTLLAYGGGWGDAARGFDALHLHELAHEWWGNLVTAADNRHLWLHEGLATYAALLYAEDRIGPGAARRERDRIFDALPSEGRLVPAAPQDAATMLTGARAGATYRRGAAVLHTLRHLVGETAFRETLRRFAYPTPALAASTDGRAARLLTSDDFARAAEAASGRDLGWFFDAYLYAETLPRLVREATPGGVRLRWEVPGGRAFPMPVDVVVDGRRRRVAVPPEGVVLRGAVGAVDPEGRILRAGG